MMTFGGAGEHVSELVFRSFRTEQAVVRAGRLQYAESRRTCITSPSKVGLHDTTRISL